MSHVVSRAHFLIFPSNFWEHSACYDKVDDLQEKQDGFHFYSILANTALQTLCLEFNRKIKKRGKRKGLFNQRVMFILIRGLYSMCGESRYSLRSEAKQTRALHHGLHFCPSSHFLSLTHSLFPLHCFLLIFSGYVTCS